MTTDDRPRIEISTDGACLGNPGPGGWGAILRAGQHEKELSGAEPDTTNNRMELTAAIRALEALKQPSRVDLRTDSTYVRNGIMSWVANWQRNGWRTSAKQPVKNADLWRELVAACERHEVTWPAPSSDPWAVTCSPITPPGGELLADRRPR